MCTYWEPPQKNLRELCPYQERCSKETTIRNPVYDSTYEVPDATVLGASTLLLWNAENFSCIRSTLRTPSGNSQKYVTCEMNLSIRPVEIRADLGLVAPSGFRFRLAKVRNRNGSRNSSGIPKMTGSVPNDFRNPSAFVDRKRNRKPEELRNSGIYTHIMTVSHDSDSHTNILYYRRQLEVQVVRFCKKFIIITICCYLLLLLLCIYNVLCT
jgi:hypothetical protein